MPHSTRPLIALLFGLASLASARDVNQPVGRGNFEIGTGYGYSAIPGTYDASGDYTALPDSFVTRLHTIPVRLKLGLGHGLDLRAEWDRIHLNNETNGDNQGMGQPRLGFRYIRPLAGVFATVTLPYATEDYEDATLHTDLEVGGLIRKRTKSFRLTALAAYGRNSNDDSRYRLSFTPTYLWGQGLEVYGGLEYARGINVDAYLLLLNPGVRMDLSKAVYVDVAAPLTVAGRGDPVVPAGWGVRAIVYWTPGR